MPDSPWTPPTRTDEQPPRTLRPAPRQPHAPEHPRAVRPRTRPAKHSPAHDRRNPTAPAGTATARGGGSARRSRAGNMKIPGNGPSERPGEGSHHQPGERLRGLTRKGLGTDSTKGPAMAPGTARRRGPGASPGRSPRADPPRRPVPGPANGPAKDPRGPRWPREGAAGNNPSQGPANAPERGPRAAPRRSPGPGAPPPPPGMGPADGTGPAGSPGPDPPQGPETGRAKGPAKRAAAVRRRFGKKVLESRVSICDLRALSQCGPEKGPPTRKRGTTCSTPWWNASSS